MQEREKISQVEISINSFLFNAFDSYFDLNLNDAWRVDGESHLVDQSLESANAAVSRGLRDGEWKKGESIPKLFNGRDR